MRGSFQWLLVLSGLALAGWIGWFIGHETTDRQAAEPGVAQTAPALAGPASSVQAVVAGPDRASTVASAALAAMPPQGLPLAQSFAALRARAAAGDLNAASRLYHELLHCHNALRNQQRLLFRSALTLAFAASDADLAFADKTMDRGRDIALHCNGVSADMLDQLDDAMLRAARLGDTQARACYVYRGPGIDMQSLLRAPQSLRVYRNAAPQLIDQALEEGDWAMVRVLMHASRFVGPNEPASVDDLATALLGPDPIRLYRYSKLYSLGAGGLASSLMELGLDQAASRLSPEQRAEADAWARAFHQQHFADNPQHGRMRLSQLCRANSGGL